MRRYQRPLVIDAKFPLEAATALREAKTDEERTGLEIAPVPWCHLRWILDARLRGHDA